MVVTVSDGENQRMMVESLPRRVAGGAMKRLCSPRIPDFSATTLSSVLHRHEPGYDGEEGRQETQATLKCRILTLIRTNCHSPERRVAPLAHK